MALQVARDQEKRTVEVNRNSLIYTLEKNRQKHVQDYLDAMAGYKSVLLEKINNSIEQAKKLIEATHQKLIVQVSTFTEEEIAKQEDTFTVLDGIYLAMRVPRSYSWQYDAAIDMAKWDVRETLELSYAEFTCFVRDQWDWKASFGAVTTMYKSI